MDLKYNPYDFANPVSDISLLVGREKEMDEIKYYLDNAKAAPRPINIALLGPRASGKTSILNIAEYESKKRGFCSVRINLDEGAIENELSFFSKLFSSILSQACHSGAFEGTDGKTYDTYLNLMYAYDIPEDKTFCPFLFPIQYAKAMSIGNIGAHIPDNTFIDDLIQIYEELKRPILLLFDEGNILSNSRILLQKLRNIFMNITGYMLVLTGTPDFIPAMDEVFSPILRQFKKINVGQFSAVNDTLNCIKRPLEKLDIQAEEIFDFGNFQDVMDIHNLSGGQPYEIQLICHVLFRRVQSKRAETMKLNFSVLDEVRRELETWQDITSRPILTNVRNLSESQLNILGLLCSCNGKATFEQLWGVEYIIRGETSWTKDVINIEFQKFVNNGTLKINEGNVSFAGDDFDKIYTKYFAREKGHKLNFLIKTIEDYWREQLNDFIKKFMKNQLEVLFNQLNSFNIIGVDFIEFLQSRQLDILFEQLNYSLLSGVDFIELLKEIGIQDSNKDYFVDYGPLAHSVYTMMVEQQDQLTISILTINPYLPWLNLQTAYRIKNSVGEDTLEAGINQIKALGERVAELGGNLVVESKTVPVVPLQILVDKVLHTANASVRNLLSSFHQIRMVDKYGDPLSREEALLHADLALQYDPDPSMKTSNNLGYIFLGANDFDKAEILLNRAINLCQSNNSKEGDDPAFPALPIYNLGVLHAEREQFENARNNFRTCINLIQNLSPDDREMSWLWVPAWHNEMLVFEEHKSPDLLNAAEIASATIEHLLAGENNEDKSNDTMTD